MNRPSATKLRKPTTAPQPEEPPGAEEAAAARFRRDGNHEPPAHHHGTLGAYRRDRCRCGPCRAANRDAQRRRRRAIAYGQWQPFVDADPIRAHVTQLAAAGLSLRRIAELSGVSRGCIDALIRGKPARGRAPSHRIRAATAARLLLLTPYSGQPADRTAHTNAAAARRRLQELIALGWSMSRIAQQLHCTHSHISRLLTREVITGATDRQIQDLHARLSSKPPYPTTAREQSSLDAARRYATQRGWHPPPTSLPDRSHADEDALGNVVAVHRAVEGRPVVQNPAERQAAAAQLPAKPPPRGQIAHHPGTHIDQRNGPAEGDLL
jgi:transcriptional regulator with XRE-family HTH domain